MRRRAGIARLDRSTDEKRSLTIPRTMLLRADVIA